MDEEIRRGKDLIEQGHDRQDELYDLLAKLDQLRAQAQNDVELTKATLKDANEIYVTLKGKYYYFYTIFKHNLYNSYFGNSVTLLFHYFKDRFFIGHNFTHNVIKK